MFACDGKLREICNGFTEMRKGKSETPWPRVQQPCALPGSPALAAGLRGLSHRLGRHAPALQRGTKGLPIASRSQPSLIKGQLRGSGAGAHQAPVLFWLTQPQLPPACPMRLSPAPPLAVWELPDPLSSPGSAGESCWGMRQAGEPCSCLPTGSCVHSPTHWGSMLAKEMSIGMGIFIPIPWI